MGNVFGPPEKPIKEVVRENQRTIKKAIRELEKEIKDLEKNEKKLGADIKKMAKQNQMGAVRVMAKDLVRTKNYITKFITMKTHLNAVALKIQTIKSHDQMATAMKGVTKALVQMNKQISLPGLNKIMTDFMRENEKNEVMQEVIGDTLDDAMEEEGSAAEEDAIVNQVLDELGIGAGQLAPDAPTLQVNSSQQAQAVNSHEDAAVSELEARLQNLNK